MDHPSDTQVPLPPKGRPLHTWRAEAERGEGQLTQGSGQGGGQRLAREGGSQPVLPDSQSMLSTDRPCLPICALTSTLLQPRLSGSCARWFAFLPGLQPLPHHPPLSNPLIIFTTAAPTPAAQQLLCGCHTPKGALYTFPRVP